MTKWLGRVKLSDEIAELFSELNGYSEYEDYSYFYDLQRRAKAVQAAKEWRKNNLERSRAHNRESLKRWRKRYPEKYKAAKKRYATKYPDKIRALNTKNQRARRARLKALKATANNGQ